MSSIFSKPVKPAHLNALSLYWQPGLNNPGREFCGASLVGLSASSGFSMHSEADGVHSTCMQILATAAAQLPSVAVNSLSYALLGDFTLELGVKTDALVNTDRRLLGQSTTTPHFHVNTSHLYPYFGQDFVLSGTLTANAWNHIRVCRSGTTINTYINGVRTNTRTGAGLDIGYLPPNSALILGNASGGAGCVGWRFSYYKIFQGIARASGASYDYLAELGADFRWCLEN